MKTAQIKPATYCDYTDKTAEQWRNSLANSEVSSYTFINEYTAVKVINGVAYVKRYHEQSKTVGTVEIRGEI